MSETTNKTQEEQAKMQAVQAFQLAMALLPMVQTGVTEFVKWIQSLRKAAQQSGEWTPALELQFRAGLWARTGEKRYKPDNG